MAFVHIVMGARRVRHWCSKRGVKWENQALTGRKAEPFAPAWQAGMEKYSYTGQRLAGYLVTFCVLVPLLALVD